MRILLGTRYLFCFALVLLGLNGPSVQAQDTLRVMQYNLLLYGASQSGCTPDAPSVKNTFLTTILGAAQPDVIGLNELGSSTLHMENILQNVLWPMTTNWERTTYTNTASSNVTNGFFYRKDKMELVEEKVLTHWLRDINVYRFYLKDPNLSTTQDTTYMTFVVVHLKAGDATSDRNTREDQATVIMNYLDGLGMAGNYFVMGDLNIDASTEASYQVMVNHSNADVQMNDPINNTGTWTSNAAKAAVHTQSTRTSSQACGSGGGMDDRFDFILVSDYVMNNTDGVGYVPGTYKAFGQDGAHYNDAINAGGNSAVSNNVANALVGLSDHLPVVADFAVPTVGVAIEEALPQGYGLGLAVVGNPVGEEAALDLMVDQRGSFTLELRDLSGRLLWQRGLDLDGGLNRYSFSTAGMASGVYLVGLRDEAGRVRFGKLIKR